MRPVIGQEGGVVVADVQETDLEAVIGDEPDEFACFRCDRGLVQEHEQAVDPFGRERIGGREEREEQAGWGLMFVREGVSGWGLLTMMVLVLVVMGKRMLMAVDGHFKGGRETRRWTAGQFMRGFQTRPG